VGTIIRYQQITDEFTTYRLSAPYDEHGNSLVHNIGTWSDGYTYVIVPDGVTLPAQTLTIEPVTVDAAFIAMAKAESQHVQLAQIREDGVQNQPAHEDMQQIYFFEDNGFIDIKRGDFSTDYSEDFY
jgi:hypothetical protein